MNEATRRAMNRIGSAGRPTVETFTTVEDFKRAYEQLVLDSPDVVNAAIGLFLEQQVVFWFDALPQCEFRVSSSKVLLPTDFGFILHLTSRGRTTAPQTLFGFLRREFTHPLSLLTATVGLVTGWFIAYHANNAAAQALLSSAIPALAIFSAIIVMFSDKLMWQVPLDDPRMLGNPKYHRFLNDDRNILLVISWAALASVVGLIVQVDVDAVPNWLASIAVFAASSFVVCVLLWLMVECFPYYMTRGVGLVNVTTIDRFRDEVVFGGQSKDTSPERRP